MLLRNFHHGRIEHALSMTKVDAFLKWGIFLEKERGLARQKTLIYDFVWAFLKHKFLPPFHNIERPHTP